MRHSRISNIHISTIDFIKMTDENKKENDLELMQVRQKFTGDIREICDEVSEVFGEKLDPIMYVSELIADIAGDKRQKKKGLTRKTFVAQESLLSKMLVHERDENYKTILNMIIVVITLWALGLAFEDFQLSGRINVDMIVWAFAKDFPGFVRHWSILFFLSFGIVPLANAAANADSKGVFWMVTTGYIGLQFILGYLATKAVQSSGFAMPLAAGLMAEQCRLGMKIHSYYREKVCWQRFDEKFAKRPSTTSIELKRFFRFMFVPTIVYRDQYPRTGKPINWSNVLQRLIEVVGVVYFFFLLFRTTLPALQETAGYPIELSVFAKLTFHCMATVMAVMFLTHFMVLHTVQNIGAELTQFADRGFYQDWWTSRTFTVFYRKWNGVVHDFIHSYMYMDMVELLGMNKIVAMLSAFIISAVIHEYIIMVSMGFFLPVLGILFTGPGK